MENNTYPVIQEWHELLENGVISDEEFLAKKNELLNLDKSNKISNASKKKKKSPILLSLILILFFVGAFFVYYFYLRPMGNAIENSPVIVREVETSESTNTANGLYTVVSSSSNRAYFHNEPKLETKRKAYVTTEDSFIVLRLENGFGYVEFENNNGNKTTGWLNLDEIKECLDCE